jgi:hypothetical protein
LSGAGWEERTLFVSLSVEKEELTLFGADAETRLSERIRTGPTDLKFI